MDKQKQGRRKHLEDTLAGDGTAWVATGTIKEIAAMAKVCSRTSDRVRRLTFH